LNMAESLLRAHALYWITSLQVLQCSYRFGILIENQLIIWFWRTFSRNLSSKALFIARNHKSSTSSGHGLAHTLIASKVQSDSLI